MRSEYTEQCRLNGRRNNLNSFRAPEVTWLKWRGLNVVLNTAVNNEDQSCITLLLAVPKRGTM